ncbi:hypothetical protein DB346_19965 [Verrucomicrobia bacterium LW23]|nr:hypothetical protein DB346_19965 [Verrucomicrobia bacterium LW23]
MAAAAVLTFSLVICNSIAQEQLDVQMSLKRNDFMLFEPIIVEVSIKNNGTEDVTLSSNDPDKPWISFLMRDSRGKSVRPDLGAIYPDRVVRAQGPPLRLTLDITPYYMLRDVGEYKIQCAIKVQGMVNHLVTEPAQRFQISEGRQLYTVSHRYKDALLTYSVMRFSPDLSSTYVYLRVVNEAGNRVLSNTILGDMADTQTPQLLFDNNGNVHVMHVIGVGTYRYSRLNPTGRELQEQLVYKSSQGIPPQIVAHNGAVVVAGGQEDMSGKRAKLSQNQQGAPNPGAGPPPNFPGTPNKRGTISNPGQIADTSATPANPGSPAPFAPPTRGAGGVPPPEIPAAAAPPPAQSASRPDNGGMPSRGARSK